MSAAWAHLTDITTSGPDLAIHNEVLLQHLYLGLSRETAQFLDTAPGGSLFHVSIHEGRYIIVPLRGGVVDDFSLVVIVLILTSATSKAFVSILEYIAAMKDAMVRACVDFLTPIINELITFLAFVCVGRNRVWLQQHT